MHTLDAVVIPILSERLQNIAKALGDKFDAIGIISGLLPGTELALRNVIEAKRSSNQLVIVLETSGGVAEIVERMVSVIRHFYSEVCFVIPSHAMSAGTIFSMSGDKIYMDYYSCLGPIDPQVIKDGKPLPVAGYLRQFEDIKQKSLQGQVSPVEYALINKLDLGELESYIDAEKLTIDLLVSWLSNYKFKDWNVPTDQKKSRAKEIAKELGNNRRWHSHGRMIGISELRGMNLKIEDLADTLDLHKAVKEYHTLAIDCMRRFEMVRLVQMKDMFI